SYPNERSVDRTTLLRVSTCAGCCARTDEWKRAGAARLVPLSQRGARGLNEKVEQGEDQIGRWRPLVFLPVGVVRLHAQREATLQSIENEKLPANFVRGSTRPLVRDRDRLGLHEGLGAAGATDLTSGIRVGAGRLAVVVATAIRHRHMIGASAFAALVL